MGMRLYNKAMAKTLLLKLGEAGLSVECHSGNLWNVSNASGRMLTWWPFSPKQTVMVPMGGPSEPGASVERIIELMGQDKIRFRTEDTSGAGELPVRKTLADVVQALQQEVADLRAEVAELRRQ